MTVLRHVLHTRCVPMRMSFSESKRKMVSSSSGIARALEVAGSVSFIVMYSKVSNLTSITDNMCL